MSIRSSFQKNPQNYFLPVIFSLITFYFTYHAVQGNRGFFRLLSTQDEIVRTQHQLDRLQKERDFIEQRMNALSGQAFDVDYLEEIAEKNMGYISPTAFVFFDKKD